MTTYMPGEKVSPEVVAQRRLWIEGLRSGRFSQAHGRLRDGDMMCCLGVACDVTGLGNWELEDELWALVLDSEEGSRYPKMPPEDEFEELFGLDYAGISRLSALNDGSAMQNILTHDFDGIADMLEAWFGPDLDQVPDPELISVTGLR